MKKLYISILLILCTAGLYAQNWQALGSGVGSASTQVYAIAYDNAGGIYAGGDFPGYLKKWNGSTWSSVGADPNGPVYSIAVKSPNEIYVGGSFTSIGGVAAKYIARLNGGTFYPIGTGLNNTVRSIYVNSSNGNVYAGGDFTVDGDNGDTTYNHIAKITIASSRYYIVPVGSGINSNVYSIVEHIPVTNGAFVLYVGTDNFSAPVSKFESATWSTVTGLTGGYVYALASYGGYLYAGGDFSSPTYAAARYSVSGGWGTTMTNFSATSIVRSMLVRGANSSATGILYIGGLFTNVTTSNVNYIGFLNSTTSTLKKVINSGTDLNGGVYAISNQSGKVISGGKFSTPGINAVITDMTIGIDDINQNLVSSSLFPNPMTDRASVRIETKERLKNPTIEIYDLQSRIVTGINSSSVLESNKAEFILERSGLSNGTYFYIVRDEDQIIATDRFIVY
jgi:hypothetical protein